MKQLPNGLHVPEDYQPPEPNRGGWPPALDIPSDAKTSSAHMGVDSERRAELVIGWFGGLPHRIPTEARPPRPASGENDERRVTL
jgi:hypothetical protein